MDSENAKGNAIMAVTVVGLIVAIVFIDKIMKAIDAINPFSDDETDKAAEKSSTKADKLGYWNPAFIKNAPSGTALLTVSAANIKASNIHDAIGVVYDSPEKIKAAFGNIVTKSQVSFLAYIFNKNYSKDLYTFLNEKLDTDSQQKVWTSILDRLNSLPDFKAK